MRHRFSSSSVALAAVIALGLGAAVPARAAVTFSSGTTTINFAITGNVFVMGSAVVNLVAGGSISGALLAENSSTVNISGGSIGGGLFAFDSSTVNLSGGSIGGALFVEDCSTVNVYGCNLALMSDVLTGTLLDGTSINQPVLLLGGQVVLHNASFADALAFLNQMQAAGAISTTAANLIRGELQMAQAGFNVCPNLRCALCFAQSAVTANRPGASTLGLLLVGEIRSLLACNGC